MTRPQLWRLGANTLLLGLWVWLYRPVLDYLAFIFSHEDFRTNQIILLGVIILIAAQVRQGGLRFALTSPPHLYAPALTLVLGGSVLYLLVERYLDINTLSASVFGLASYGLLGLWLSPRAWRQGLPAALLLIGALPFGDHMQTFIGYPMRIVTAALVRDGLASLGVGSLGIDTILVFENGVSQVDLPCSGVKSLWTGLLFLVAATWLERKPLNGRWLLVAALFAGSLFATNLARVATLVAVGQVLGWRLLAEMLHVPLGVLGFALACGVAVFLLRFVALAYESSASQSISDESIHPGSAKPAWLTPVLASALLGLALLYTPRPFTGLTKPAPHWDFPSTLATTPMPLKPDEVAWLTRDGADSAERRRFVWRGVPGSMILISSATWRAHHRPERCFEVLGLSLDGSFTHLIQTDFPVRVVSLSQGAIRDKVAAVYWFQSPQTTTDDYATRIWADLAPQRELWILISIVFEEPIDPMSADLQALYIELNATIARHLKGG